AYFRSVARGNPGAGHPTGTGLDAGGHRRRVLRAPGRGCAGRAARVLPLVVAGPACGAHQRRSGGHIFGQSGASAVHRADAARVGQGFALSGAHASRARHFLPDRRGHLLGGADRPDPDTDPLGPEVQAGHMNTTLLAFFVYWGIWIVVPFLVDGLSALILFGGVVWARLRGRFQPYSGALDFYPTLSVIIPVLNGEHSLAACLQSIRAQTYPAERLEVVVVDNGSSDRTFEVFNSVQQEAFGGQLQWVKTQYRGKPWALNAGIHLTSGHYMVNIDADVVLAPDALSQMVAAFEADPALSAATG